MRRLFGKIFHGDKEQPGRQSLSTARRFLISLFLRPRGTETITDGGWGVSWHAALGEDPAIVLARLAQLGHLRRATTREALTVRYTVASLKGDLRVRGLKLSGRKHYLIERLMEADPKYCAAQMGNHRVLVCSDTGAAIGNQYARERRAMREAAEHAALCFVVKRRFNDAARAIRQFNSGEVFLPRLNFSADGLEAIHHELLHHLFSGGPPRILGQIKPEAAEALMLAAAMSQLGADKAHKRYLPEGFHSGSHLSDEVALRMIGFAASHRRKMASLPEIEVGHVRIRGVSDGNGCEACTALDGKLFRVDDAPELPYAGCTCDGGCRCIALAVLDEYD